MSNFFDSDNGFMQGFTKVTDTLILSILWLVCCVPVVTVGAASSALYYAFHKSIRQSRSYAWREFFAAFKSNFKRSTGIWLILLVFMLMSLVACLLLGAMRDSTPMAGVCLVMGVVILCFTAVWCIYALAYQARFENTMGAVLKNSALLTFANLPRSILLLILFAAAVIAVIYMPVICGPVVAVFIWLENKILERVFRKLMTEEDLMSELELDRG